MPIQEYEIDVVISTTVKVRINTDTFNEEKMAGFRKDFYRFTTHEEHAKHLAQYAVRFDIASRRHRGTFIEGYGQVRVDDNAGNTYDETGNNPQPIEPWEDINIIVGEEDVEMELQNTKVVSSLLSGM